MTGWNNATTTFTCATCGTTTSKGAGRVMFVDGREVRVCNPCKNRIMQERAQAARAARKEKG